jgi:hypothetical protein
VAVGVTPAAVAVMAAAVLETDMAINDSDVTRIKARDAKTVLDAGDPIGVLASLGHELGFKVLGAIRVNRQSQGYPMVLTWTRTPGDQDVLDTYLKALAKTAEPQFSAAIGLLIFGIHDDGMAEVATWGVTANDCKRLGAWGSLILKGLPVSPFQTWFGWGNGGVPKRMSAARLATLNPQQKLFVERYTHPHAVA